MAQAGGPPWGQQGWGPPDAHGPFCYGLEVPLFPGWCQPPSPHFPERRVAPGGLTAQGKESCCLWHFSTSATEKQNQPKGLFNCNIKKIMIFQGKKESSPPLWFQCNTVSADSVPFKPKQAHLSSQKVPFKRTLSTGMYFTSNVPSPLILVQAVNPSRAGMEGRR